MYIDEAAEIVSTGLSRKSTGSENKSDDLICDMQNPLLHPYQTNFYGFIVDQINLMFNIKLILMFN